jgi:hypothetical protein
MTYQWKNVSTEHHVSDEVVTLSKGQFDIMIGGSGGFSEAARNLRAAIVAKESMEEDA